MPLPRHVRKLGNKRAMKLKVQKHKFLSFASPLKLAADITALEIVHARKAASQHNTALRKLISEHMAAIKVFNPSVAVKLSTSEEAPAAMTVHRGTASETVTAATADELLASIAAAEAR